MPDPIRGKVARILNSREIAINIGSKRGVLVGMRFDVMDRTGADVTDPETGESLGSIERPKVRVEVSSVQERLSVARTYRKETVNVGGVGFSGGSVGAVGSLSQMLMPPKWVTTYETLKTREETWEDLDEEDSYVKIGDPVVQVLSDIEERGAESEHADEPVAEVTPEVSH